ncbi:MAG: glycosyl transferase [Nocardioidaceae bacterium]|nr:glycosyl transferase [Nocardioidaceae bacterium]
MSVVLPSYNNARFVAETVESVLAQTYDDFELVIADHSSTDGTWDVLQRFRADPRVRLLETPAGGGAERNWNRVTDEARGTYVKLVCGDDLIYPTCLEVQAAALEAHPSAGVTACARDLVDVSGGLLLAGRGMTGLEGLVPGREAIRRIVRAGTNLMGEPGCVLLRADLLRRIGGWTATYPYLIDQFSYLSALQHADLVGDRRTLAAFRVSNTQWSVSLATEQGKQAGQVHQYFHEVEPDAVSAWDERVGTLRAYRTAWARRAAYVVWRKRMREAA